MKTRQINQYLWDTELISDKMIFLSGPRQVGKTTYSKEILKKKLQGNYYNWDSPSVRKQYLEDAFFFLKGLKAGKKSLIIFDEIHKRNKWKDVLKGIYDSIEKNHRILVTGSARLELFRKSGDSLVGNAAQART